MLTNFSCCTTPLASATANDSSHMSAHCRLRLAHSRGTSEWHDAGGRWRAGMPQSAADATAGHRRLSRSRSSELRNWHWLYLRCSQGSWCLQRALERQDVVQHYIQLGCVKTFAAMPRRRVCCHDDEQLCTSEIKSMIHNIHINSP